MKAGAENVNYRMIEPKDLSELIEVRGSTRENAVNREQLRSVGITEESTTALLQTTHRGWLCENEGKFVGFAMGNGKTGEVWVLAVLPDFEGKGIGSKLLSLTEEWLWSAGWKEIWLHTNPDQKVRASHFYRHRGWKDSENIDGKLFMKKKKS